jgi:hypothetical protein
MISLLCCPLKFLFFQRISAGQPESLPVVKRMEEVDDSHSFDSRTVVIRSPGPTLISLQQSYHGTYAIPNSLANRSCAGFDTDSLLMELNGICGTNLSPSINYLNDILRMYSARNYDFGMIYGRLRHWIMDPSQSQSLAGLYRIEEKLGEGKQETYSFGPRRIWDLYSNRVLLHEVAFPRERADRIRNLEDVGKLDCISHAWRPKEDRQSAMTYINGHEWPVPIPNGTSLDCIRTEMLNLGEEYVWLDVLCLRQEGGVNEHLRADEWKTDIPNIGKLYKFCRNIIVYLNGLGLPFRETDLDSPFFWSNRAWTLQEAKCLRLQSMHVAGITPNSPQMEFTGLKPGNLIPAPNTQSSFETQLAPRLTIMEDIDFVFTAVAEMRRRSSTTEIDKIAGLLQIFYSIDHGPESFEYRASDTPEEAWTKFLRDPLKGQVNGDLFFLFPTRGDATLKCLPSWRQLQDPDFSPPKRPETGPWASIRFDPDVRTFVCSPVILLRECRVELLYDLPGQSVVNTSENSFHHGRITYEDISFLVEYCHSDHLVDGRYSLVGNAYRHSACKFWVAGHLEILEAGGRPVFCKIATLQVNNDAMLQDLRSKLGLYMPDSDSSDSDDSDMDAYSYKGGTFSLDTATASRFHYQYPKLMWRYLTIILQIQIRVFSQHPITTSPCIVVSESFQSQLLSNRMTYLVPCSLVDLEGINSEAVDVPS